MKPQELLQPRYKVIATYPGSHFRVGTIAHFEKFHIDAEDDSPEYFFENYPHLFKKLEWWEERKPEDMPEYVGYSGWIGIDGDMTEFNGEYEDVIKVKRHHLKAFDGAYFLSENNEQVSYTVWYPATKEEYEAFINQKEI